MNLMEAEHVQKKYRIIQGSLLEDRVAFESSLVKIEEDIKKQEAEIRHLKVSNGWTGYVSEATDRKTDLLLCVCYRKYMVRHLGCGMQRGAHW
jgi:septation ring formation regulator EzrA